MSDELRYEPHYDDEGNPLSLPVHLPAGVTRHHDELASKAVAQAYRTVWVPEGWFDPQKKHKVKHVADWRLRGAPSPGARARYILSDLCAGDPPSAYPLAELALRLYFSPEQMAERNARPRVRGGLHL